MAGVGPKSIRGRTVLITVVLSAVAMALITVAVSWGMFSALRSTLLEELEERLDAVSSSVERGKLEIATNSASSVLLAVLDAEGKLVATSTDSANRIDFSKLLAGKDRDDFDVDDLDEREDVDEEDEDDDDAVPVVAPAAQDAADAAASASSASADDDADDDSDYDDYDSDDDDYSSYGGSGRSSGGSGGISGSDDSDADADDDSHDTSDDSYDSGDSDSYEDDSSDDDYEEPESADTHDAVSPSYDSGSYDDYDSSSYDYDDYDDSDYDDGDSDYDASDSDYDSGDSDDDDDDDRGAGFIPLRIFMKAAVFSASGAVEQGTPITDALMQQITGKPGPYLVAQRKVANDSDSYTLVAITSLATAVSSAQRAAFALAGIFLLLLGAIAWFTWMMSGATLRPVEEMRAATEAIISSDRLSSRIPVPVHDRDLSPLAETFNEVIARMEADLVSQRRFISDASHELKSPVAASAIILETLTENPKAANTEEALEDLVRENSRMQSIVADLLALARYDEGSTSADLAPADVIDIVFEQVAALRAKTDKTVDTSGVEPVIARVDARLLSHALRNLMENAERYAKTRVAVTCTERGGMLVLAVDDDGCGIAPEDRERVFDRFVRLSRDAESDKNSTGLGLAVVKSVAEAHGGRAYFEDSPLGGARAVLELPLG